MKSKVKSLEATESTVFLRSRHGTIILGDSLKYLASCEVPSALPEYFIRMVSDHGDLVIDPFAGSCVVGEVCERLGRKWVCIEIVEDYLRGALGRFQEQPQPEQNHLYARA